MSPSPLSPAAPKHHLATEIVADLPAKRAKLDEIAEWENAVPPPGGIPADNDSWYGGWEVDTSKEAMMEINRVSEEKKKELDGPDKPETPSQRWRRKKKEKAEKEMEEKGLATPETPAQKPSTSGAAVRRATAKKVTAAKPKPPKEKKGKKGRGKGKGKEKEKEKEKENWIITTSDEEEEEEEED